MTVTHVPGANYLGQQRCRFDVWAPRVKVLDVAFVASRQDGVRLTRTADGWHTATVDGISPGTRYHLLLDGERRRPDPAARLQPEGVHGPSEVVDPAFAWEDGDWRGIELEDCVIYELHVGTFTEAGTFDALHAHLARLRDLGVTVIELMPIAQFPGARNWGYDGVGLYAVQNTYGGPVGLKRLVNACHKAGLAVMLDVVYNHLGPEGNYLGEFGPYFTDDVRTPWGSAINFAGRDSDEVRRFFIANALQWVDEFHLDGLRLDAVHAYHDPTARPFLAALNEAVQQRAASLGRRVLMIAESNLNDPQIVRPQAQGGAGCDAQWADDFHHALHVALTGERHGYYADFDGLAALGEAYQEAFVFRGQYSQYRGRRHGRAPVDVPFERFVVCAQNHDQIGNRMTGERLSTLVDAESLKLAAGAVLLAPFVPLLFMGEEYGEPVPFLYFVSHTDAGLVEAVRRGRRAEFATFAWQGEPPDPQAPETFARCRLDHGLVEHEPHGTLWRFHQALLALRRTRPSLHRLDRSALQVRTLAAEQVITLQRWHGAEHTLVVLNFNTAAVNIGLPAAPGGWTSLLDSATFDAHTAANGTASQVRHDSETQITRAPRSVVVYGGSREHA